MTISQLRKIGSNLLLISVVFFILSIVVMLVGLSTNPFSVAIGIIFSAILFISGSAFVFAVLLGIDIDNKRNRGEE